MGIQAEKKPFLGVFTVWSIPNLIDTSTFFVLPSAPYPLSPDVSQIHLVTWHIAENHAERTPQSSPVKELHQNQLNSGEQFGNFKEAPSHNDLNAYLHLIISSAYL